MTSNLDTAVTDADVERIAKAISRMVPMDGSSRWHPGHGHDFPREYSEAEQRLIRGIASAALSARVPALPQVGGEVEPDFLYFECPECEFSSVQPADFKGSSACPMCAGDSGHDVGMHKRTARSSDKPEGKDARPGALASQAVETKAVAASTGAGMVRGLEWHLESSRRQRGYWRAYSEVGTYDINEHPDGAYGVSGRVVVWPLGTLDEAKAAAQADYERRIMSALEPVEAEAEPVAFVIERTLAMGGKHWYLPFLRAGEEVERYRKNSPDEKLVPLYTTPNPHAALKQEGSK